MEQNYWINSRVQSSPLRERRIDWLDSHLDLGGVEGKNVVLSFSTTEVKNSEECCEKCVRCCLLGTRIRPQEVETWLAGWTGLNLEHLSFIDGFDWGYLKGKHTTLHLQYLVDTKPPASPGICGHARRYGSRLSLRPSQRSYERKSVRWTSYCMQSTNLSKYLLASWVNWASRNHTNDTLLRDFFAPK